MILLLILTAGMITYLSVPKEEAPDVQKPSIYTSMSHEGISPDDAERLLLRPMEKELQGIEGVKEVRSIATQGFGSVMLEFDAGFDSDKALLDVREKVDMARPELPEETEEPVVQEENYSLFPVVNVILTGDIPERTLIKLARSLRDNIEELSSVLDVKIAGDREESVDIIIDPLMLESYDLTSDIVQFVTRNNLLVAAGAIDTGAGRHVIKVPGLLENLNDILELPVKVNKDAVVKVGDIATVHKTFKDPENFARVNGKPAVALEVSKRTGENIIETIDKVKEIVEAERQYWPEGVNVLFAQDTSTRIKNMVSDLQNNVLLAIFLVFVVIIFFIGMRSGTLVAIAIPGAFLFGILTLSFLDLTLNIVVLFSLILSIGMLVDSAIVVVEYANRRMIDGVSYRQAYGEAAKRMSWPIIASTVTTLLVFAPLLFWPGIMGQFMKFMPLTLIATLTGSLLMALIFIPVLGTWFGKVDSFDDRTERSIRAGEGGDIHNVDGLTGGYVSLLDRVLRLPGIFAALILALILLIFFGYKTFGVGSEFFPSIEPENAQVIVHARGNMSVFEKDKLVSEVEERISDMTDEVKVFYTSAGKVDGGAKGGALAEDAIGLIQLEYQDWEIRRPSAEILAEIRRRTADLPGIMVETGEDKPGPPSSKPIELELSSRFPDKVSPAVETILEGMKEIGGFIDTEDSRPIPGIEWQLDVDREKAARFGADMLVVGNFIRMVTNGLKATTYRPDDSDDEVDILLRFPSSDRRLDTLDNLRAITDNGPVPISNFVTRKAKPKLGKIERVNGVRVISIKADVEEGLLANNKLKEMESWLKQAYESGRLDPEVRIAFKGEDEDQKETGAFLMNAFILALSAMTLVLLMQFNNIWHTVIIMSAVFLSTGGVVLGLLVTVQPFGIVMCGVGIIALAGIVVNNNIIFIDTYKILRESGMNAREALLRTGAQRIRPILLTAGTTILGLIPMVVGMNIDFIGRDLTFGAPASQWWQQMSTSIAGGLAFATILTLFFTPSLLMLGERRRERRQKRITGTHPTQQLV